MDADIWGREKLSLLQHLSPWGQAEKYLFPTLASPFAVMPSCLCSTQVYTTGYADMSGTAAQQCLETNGLHKELGSI